MADLFRKTSLEKLSSPEQLDRAIVITPPMFWIALVGGFLMIAGVLLWAVFGKIPVNVEEQGIYISQESDEREASVGQVYCYMSLSDGKKIVAGMKAMIYPTTVNSQESGYMTGTVQFVANYVTSKEEMEEHLGNSTLVDSFLENGPVVEIICSLEEDENTKSGYAWSNPKGKEVDLANGTLLDVNIVTEEKTPITMAFPMLKQFMGIS
jgi:hypothetical protein